MLPRLLHLLPLKQHQPQQVPHRHKLLLLLNGPHLLVLVLPALEVLMDTSAVFHQTRRLDLVPLSKDTYRPSHKRLLFVDLVPLIKDT